MYIDAKKSWKEFWRQYKSDEKLMLEAGMSAQDCKAVLELYKQELNSDRRFYYMTSHYIDSDNETIPAPDDEEPFSYMDLLDNPVLHRALDELKIIEREIITLHILDGHSLVEVAAMLDKPYSAIQRQFHRAIQKIKKFLIENV